MDIMRSLSRQVFTPLLLWRNRNREFRFLEECEGAQWLPPEELEERRLERLRRVLITARDHCPFYRRRFEEAHFRPEEVRSFRDLASLSALTKSDIQQHGEAMVARNIDRSRLVSNQTGGSTGAPLRFFHDDECMWWRSASTIRHDRWAGLEMWDKTASLWGNRRDFAPSPGWRTGLRSTFVRRSVLFDTSHITDAKLADLVSVLKRERPAVYVAYAGAAWLLARYIRERGIEGYHRPRSIITSAELLEADQRELIEDVFGCRVFDRYGCREVSVIASECDEHEGLHVCADRLHIEIVRGERACEPGEMGEIVITDLLNFGMPFLRYRIKDMGIYVAGQCSCGRTLPRIRMAGGRVTDFLVAPDGRLVSGAAMTIYFVANIPGVSQAQLEQRQRDSLIVRVVPDSGYGADSERAIREGVARFFGADMRYEIDVVDAIDAAPSGKLRFSICELDPLEYLS